MKRAGLQETTYSSDPLLRSPRLLFRAMIADLGASRFVAWRLLLRNVVSQYRRALLGYLWLILAPLVQTFVWVFLNSRKIIVVEPTDIPYPAFVLTGVLLWQGFSEAVLSPIQQLEASKSTLTKILFPREAIVLAAMGQVLIGVALRMLLLLAAYLFLGIQLGMTALLAIFGLLALVVFGTMLGLLLGPLSLLLGDIPRALTMLLQMWFFLTPIIYPPPTGGDGSLVAWLNPVTPLIVTTRQWLCGVDVTMILPFFAVSGATVVLTIVGWVAFRVAMPRVIERIGS